MKNSAFYTNGMLFNKRILLPRRSATNAEQQQQQKKKQNIPLSCTSDTFLIKLHGSHVGNIVIVKKGTLEAEALKNSIRWMMLLNIANVGYYVVRGVNKMTSFYQTLKKQRLLN